MTPERYQQIAQIVGEALQLPPNHRDHFLKAACEDDRELFSEVQSLLAQEKPAAELAETILPTAHHDTDHHVTPGTRIGSYQILQQLGSGGFGDVYLAEQTEPVKRRVA